MDVVPNYELSMQMLVYQMAEQRTAKERKKVEIMEMLDRKVRNLRNMEAARKALEELEGNKASAPTALDRQKIRTAIAAQQHNIEKQMLENMEADERIVKADEAIQASEESWLQYDQNLKDLEKVHGAWTEEKFLNAKETQIKEK